MGDPDGGSWPAYPSGKSWDEPSGKTGSGKKFYHNIIPGSAVPTEPFYVAIITPVIHYCMGGLAIDVDSQCLDANEKKIPGLYAAGEVAGGVHGNNRLGGNSLLDCVVFGRVAGRHCVQCMNGKIVETSLKDLSGGGLTGDVQSSKLSGGSYEDGMNNAASGAPAAGGGIAMEEVAKHITKGDCWVVVSGQVLDVTNFLSQHPGGELAILTFAGKDAAEEFNMIHPPDVIPKYAPDAIIGNVGTGGPAQTGGDAAAAPVAARKDKGDLVANHHAWGEHAGKNWRIEGMDDNPGVLLINVKAYIFAGWFLMLSVLWEVCATIFSVKNFKISNDRVGLTRSAILLILFMVIHAVGNLHVFMGPDDFNGYGYFYVRLYWTGFGLPANIVEEYILLSVLLHVFVGLKRTWDISLKRVKTSGPSVLYLAITGLMLLTFMTIHLFQFRFGDTEQFGGYMLRPPPYLINIWGIPSLTLFWTENTAVTPVPVRDIYALEFQLFQNGVWSAFYILSVFIFMVHAMLGWKKVTPVLGIPSGHVKKVEIYGYLIFLTLGVIYMSFPAWCILTVPDAGEQQDINPGRIG